MSGGGRRDSDPAYENGPPITAELGDVLPPITVTAAAPPPRATQSTGRRDHDAEYENDPPKPALVSAPPGDALTLVVAGQKFTGWTGVRVARGIEMFPSRFALQVTERDPGSSKVVSIEPGQTCQVLIGSDLVITGYVDSYRASISARGHRVTVAGRSQTEDLVDCAAGVQPGKETSATMTFSAPNLKALADTLCEPFGITVTEPDGEGQPLVSLGTGIPEFTIPLGETVYDRLSMYARWQRRLLLDGVDGNLVIAAVGTKKAAGTLSFQTAPQEEGSVEFSKSGRFSVYLPAKSTTDSAFDVSRAAAMDSLNFLQPVKDEAAFRAQNRLDGKPRYRPTFVISDQHVEGIKLAENLAEWQRARDFGRSQALRVVLSTWRDAAGKLWEVNTLVSINTVELKLAKLTWIVAEVEFVRDATGTRAILVLMPKETFEPEPTLATPYDAEIEATKRRVGDNRPVTEGGSANFNPRANEPAGGV